MSTIYLVLIIFETIELDFFSKEFKKLPEANPIKKDMNIHKSIKFEFNIVVFSEIEIIPQFIPITNNRENKAENIGRNIKYINVPVDE